MWKDYRAAFLKNNKGSSIVAAAFISALFLSLVCGLYYNLWIYEIEKITIEEGDWHGRIAGIGENDLTTIENFANVEKVEVNQPLSDGETIVADVFFRNIKTVYRDMPLIAQRLGKDGGAVSYHELLLSRYMVHDPQDDTPPLLMAFFLALLAVLSASLILIIHNSFAVSMDARIHQFGIFSSVGAAPGQIFACVMQEAAILCALPVLAGSGIGAAASAEAIQVMNSFAADMAGRHEAVFRYHPLVFAAAVFASALTVLVSASLPARKLSKLTPLQAIRNTGELSLQKTPHSRILPLLFGVEGELAGNALKAQKKALRTSTLSLTLSFLSFTVMLCFFTLTGISTNHTYFERYQDAWDVMVTLKDTGIGDFAQGEEIRALQGVRSSVVYQKAVAVCPLPESDMSEELLSLGGLGALAGNVPMAGEGNYSVKAPIVILDDVGFEEYCRQIGVEPKADGSIVLNRIWDSVNSNFRYKTYIPFVKEERAAVTLQNAAQPESTVEIPVLAYTQQTPALREEYDNDSLVQFVPLSLWNQIAGQIGGAETDTYIRILGREGVTLSELNELQAAVSGALHQDSAAALENRIQEKAADEQMQKGSAAILGAFCVLLAVIGIANVFSNTLGFLRQRGREFARYASVGMTPEGMRKMFAIEAAVIAGRPLVITLPLTIVAVAFMISASYLNPMEFLAKAPLLPVLVFLSAIFGFVGLAYYIGGKRIFAADLAETLRNDTMM